MRNSLFTWMLACTAAVLLVVSAHAADAGKTAGRILAAKVRGTVTALNKADNSRKELHDSDAITQGYVVTTADKSSVVLLFDNGASVNLGADATLSIDEFLMDPFDPKYSVADAKEEPSTSVTTLSLARGEFVGNVKHLHRDNGSAFTINTPVGAAGIRGTTFAISISVDQTGKANVNFSTVEGLVSVTMLNNLTRSIPANSTVQVAFDYSTDPQTGAITLTPGSLQVGGVTTMTAEQLQGIEAQVQLILDAITNAAGGPPAGPQVVNPPVNTTPGDGSSPSHG